MKRYALTLALKDDPQLIAEYKRQHEAVWPEIISSHREAGITNMEIYLHGNQLFMLMEVNNGFSFERKAELDAANPKVHEWENLMLRYQQPDTDAPLAAKWQLMEPIYAMPKGA